MRDLMHVHSFSYDFHLRVVHQYLVGCHMTLRQGYQLTDFLDDFISHHPDIPKFGRNHVFQGDFLAQSHIKVTPNCSKHVESPEIGKLTKGVRWKEKHIRQKT